MKKKVLIFFFLISIPFIIIASVNELVDNHPRTTKYKEAYCTWDCHNTFCKHWVNSNKDEPSKIKKFHKSVFDYYVHILHNNGMTSYRSINLWVFLVVYPILGSLLLWNIIRRISIR